jgi:hypothetical protein
MKRSLLVLLLTGAFFVFLFGLTGCGLAGQASEQDLTNAIGSSDNGPGSGKWVPPKPANQNQCAALNNTEHELAAETSKLLDTHSQTVLACYDENGKRIENSDNPLCNTPIQELEAEIENYSHDLAAGFTRYKESCVTLGAPEMDDLKPLFETLGINGSNEAPGVYRCLTCTHSLDIEVTFNPVDIELPNS